MAFPNLQSLLRQSSSSRQFLLSLPVTVQLRLHERNKFIHTQEQLRQHAAFLLHTLEHKKRTQLNQELCPFFVLFLLIY